MPSTYLRQLSDFIIPGTQVRLLEALGQGNADHASVGYCFIVLSHTCTGEFGIVYRGLLLTECGEEGIPKPVAVKTLKGIITVLQL